MSDYSEAMAEVVDRALLVAGSNLPFLDRDDLDAIIRDKIDALCIRYHCAGAEKESIATRLRDDLTTVRAECRREWVERKGIS